MTRWLALYFVVATATLVWPVYPAVGDSIAPRVFGLPWSLVYVLGVIGLNFAVLLVAYHFRLVDDEPDEPDEPDPASERH